MSELVGKTREGVNLQNGIWKIYARKQRLYLLSQFHQAERLIQFVQRSQRESIFAVELLDLHVRMARENCRGVTVSFIELLGEGLNLPIG